MDDRQTFGAPHLVRVRSAAGEVWEAAAPFVYAPALARRVAELVRAFLRRPVTAPAWVHVLRAELVSEGVEPGACVVEVARALNEAATRWRVVDEFEVCVGRVATRRASASSAASGRVSQAVLRALSTRPRCGRAGRAARR